MRGLRITTGFICVALLMIACGHGNDHPAIAAEQEPSVRLELFEGLVALGREHDAVTLLDAAAPTDPVSIQWERERARLLTDLVAEPGLVPWTYIGKEAKEAWARVQGLAGNGDAEALCGLRHVRWSLGEYEEAGAAVELLQANGNGGPSVVIRRAPLYLDSKESLSSRWRLAGGCPFRWAGPGELHFDPWIRRPYREQIRWEARLPLERSVGAARLRFLFRAERQCFGSHVFIGFAAHSDVEEERPASEAPEGYIGIIVSSGGRTIRRGDLSDDASRLGTGSHNRLLVQHSITAQKTCAFRRDPRLGVFPQKTTYRVDLHLLRSPDRVRVFVWKVLSGQDMDTLEPEEQDLWRFEDELVQDWPRDLDLVLWVYCMDQPEETLDYGRQDIRISNMELWLEDERD
ncbi:MAG: hypothetical protein V2A76_13985 [Planctomycetota bacterium]